MGNTGGMILIWEILGEKPVGEQPEKYAALKVPRQCPLVLVGVVWKQRKAIGSEEVDCQDNAEEGSTAVVWSAARKSCSATWILGAD
jgi:hypothetical protein